MTDRPIIFSAAMVRAILDGRKTQTRRLLKRHDKPAPYQVGDRLWVRESCQAIELENGDDVIRYPAGGNDIPIQNTQDAADKWGAMNHYGNRRDAVVPSIHMPRWASRITLAVTDVRVQRLQEITLGDICAEGLGQSIYDFAPAQLGFKAWENLWDSLNATRAPWNSNPWVVAVTFEPRFENIDNGVTE